ncbi:MAG: SAP domain-containing protein [Gemmatimonadales bacterium]|nr:SAP domain-containing protein [Gemmatimonadales bacterium]
MAAGRAAGTVAELRGLLRARGLPTGGKKAELVARLARADAQPEAAEAGPAAAGPEIGAAVGTLANILPTRRATRLDPANTRSGPTGGDPGSAQNALVGWRAAGYFVGRPLRLHPNFGERT